MNFFRILGLVGSGVVVGISAWSLSKYGIPNKAVEWAFITGSGLCLFNFVGLNGSQEEGLIDLWFQSKKAKLKQEIRDLNKNQ